MSFDNLQQKIFHIKCTPSLKSSTNKNKHYTLINMVVRKGNIYHYILSLIYLSGSWDRNGQIAAFWDLQTINCIQPNQPYDTFFQWCQWFKSVHAATSFVDFHFHFQIFFFCFTFEVCPWLKQYIFFNMLQNTKND